MYRGTNLFKCTKCGKIFFAPDFELGATVLSVPQPCPKCQSIRTMPWSLLSSFDESTYRDIWNKIEERK